jgi:opacity protein-like surface antigen
MIQKPRSSKVKKIFLLFFSSLFLTVLFSSQALAADEPFTSPNNWGATGLMETPTARVLKNGKFRVGVSQIDPYRYYYGAVSPVKGLEIDGRFTEILGMDISSTPGWKGYGNYKDKTVDLKYQFIAEGKYWPAMALGIMDPHGTRLWGGQYLAFSKQIFPFDFTVGLGNGRFGKKPLPPTGDSWKVEIFQDPKQWWSDANFFGGIEFAPSKKLSLLVEYNPIQYEKQTNDPGQKKYFPTAVSSNINVGMRYKPLDWAEIDVSYQRGNQIGVNLSLAFNLDKSLIPIFDLPYIEEENHKLNPLAERISYGLYASGFRDVGVKILGQNIWVEVSNTRYFYNMRALGIILRVLNGILPRDIEQINIVLAERGIPLVEFSTERESLYNFGAEIFKINEYLSLSQFKTDIYQTQKTQKKYIQLFDYGIKPEFQTFLNDPSGFFKGRAGVSGWVGVEPWKGASLSLGAEAYAWNDISSVIKPMPNAVRSDYVRYLEKDMALSSIIFEQIIKTKYEIYGKIAAGLLEAEYAGLDAEIAAPLFSGRIMSGISGSLVKKRDPDDPFKLINNDFNDHYKTAFVNARLNLPEIEIALDVKAGQFLAGDKGTRITAYKYFPNGFMLSAWYSFTDTSIFKDSFNNGYHDKGVAISIPLRLFLGRDSRTAYSYAFSPWTRDVAQDITHRTELFDFIGRNTKRYIFKDSDLISIPYPK